MQWLRNYKVFLCGRGFGTIPISTWDLSTVVSDLSTLPSASDSCCTYIPSLFGWILEEDPLPVSRVLFLCSPLLSSTLPNSKCLGRSRSSVLSSQIKYQVRQALSVVLLSVSWPRNFLKATSFGNHRVPSFVCHLLKITVLYCLISNILKIVSSFDFFWCCFSQEDKFNSCYFFLAQTRSLLHFLFKNKQKTKQTVT